MAFCHASFFKSSGYRHENEVRFILSRSNGDKNRKGVSIILNDDFYEIKKSIEVFAHPDTDLITFRLYKEELKKKGIELLPSELITKYSIKNIIK